MKKNQILKVRLNDEMARKLSVISEKERQTIQNEIVAMIRQKISYFERVKGNITREEIANASLEQFDEEQRREKREERKENVAFFALREKAFY